MSPYKGNFCLAEWEETNLGFMYFMDALFDQ